MRIIADFRGHIAAINEAAHIIFLNRQLAAVLVRREIAEPHAGQLFGWFWAVVHPLFLMAVYAVVFNLIFRARIGGTYALPLDYTVYVLSGLVPWMTFQQSMTKGTQAVTAHASLVKQIVFPLEVLPVRSAISSLVVLVLGTAFLFIYVGIKDQTVLWTYALLPLLALSMTIAMIGSAFALAALTVFVRDVRDFVQLFCIVNIYIIPAVYLPSAVPGPLRLLIYINPFSYMVWCFQDVLYFGRVQHPLAWVVFPSFSVVILALGYRLFRKLKPLFGNVL